MKEESKVSVVYVHLFNGSIVYVGVGSESRPYNTHSRSPEHTAFMRENEAELEIEILQRFDNRERAYTMEAKLIKKHKPRFNISDGVVQTYEAKVFRQAARKARKKYVQSTKKILLKALKSIAEKGMNRFAANHLAMEIKLIDPTITAFAVAKIFDELGITDAPETTIRGWRTRCYEKLDMKLPVKKPVDPSQFCKQSYGKLDESRCNSCPFVAICSLKETLFKRAANNPEFAKTPTRGRR